MVAALLTKRDEVVAPSRRRALKEANKNKKGGAEKTDAAPAVSPIKAMFDRAAEKAPEAGKADDAEGGERRTAA